MTKKPLGRPKTAEETVQVPLRLPKSLRDKLVKKALKAGLPLSTYIRMRLMEDEE